MRVIVYAQDLSGRRDDGYYTKPDIASALDIFFNPGGTKNFLDADGENEITADEAAEIFRTDNRVEFFNEDGERIVIASDPSE